LNSRLVEWIDEHHEELGFNNRSDLMRSAIRDFVMRQPEMRLPEAASAMAKDRLPDDDADEEVSPSGTTSERAQERVEPSQQEQERINGNSSSDMLTDVVQGAQAELEQRRSESDFLERFGEGGLIRAPGILRFKYHAFEQFLNEPFHPIFIPESEHELLYNHVIGRHKVGLFINGNELSEGSGLLLVSGVRGGSIPVITIRDEEFKEHVDIFEKDQIFEVDIDIIDDITIHLSL